MITKRTRRDQDQVVGALEQRRRIRPTDIEFELRPGRERQFVADIRESHEADNFVIAVRPLPHDP
jgi:hypothetical protein